MTLAAAPHAAHAQSREDAEGPRAERVEVEDVLRPRPGRARLEVTAERERSVALGVVREQPSQRESGVRFDVEREPVLCRTPCALFLRPGIQRLQGEADTPYVWNVDVPLGPEGARLRLRSHRVGLSALGAAMFIVGCAGAALGPGVIIVNLLVGDRSQLGWAALGGGIAGVLGAGLIVGGWFTVQAGAPQVTTLTRASPVTVSPLFGAGSLGIWAAF